MTKLVLVLSVMIFWLSLLSISGARPFNTRNTPDKTGCKYIPPGIWSCTTRKRSVLNYQQNILDFAQLEKRQNPNCPPGVWSCKLRGMEKFENQVREFDSQLQKHQNPNCPPGVWSCKLRGMQKIENQARRFDSTQLQKRQNPNCPPGVWSCKLQKQEKFDHQVREFHSTQYQKR